MSSNTKAILYVVSLILANAAVIAIFPASAQPYLQALASIVATIIAYFDPTHAAQSLGMSVKEFRGKAVSQNSQS